MSDPKDVILNAIRVLRSRRVRPSDAKIAWFARREFFLTEETTSETLQELVRCGDIFKVIYKGGTSYRVAPHKLAAANKLLKPPPKKLKFTPTPTDILRPLLSAVAACGSDATKERIAEELTAAGHSNLVERLDTLLQKELRVGLIGRRITLSGPGERNTASFFITKSAPLALITNRLGAVKPPPTKPASKPYQENQKLSPMPQATTKKAPAPFEHLHLHLKRLQQEKESVKGSEASETQSPSPLGDKDSKFSLTHESPTSPSQESENLLQDEKYGGDDKPLSRRGRPRKPPVIYEDLTSFTTKRGRPPKMAAAARGGKAIKRARKVFDPSDASGRRRCSTVPLDHPSGGSNVRCDVCGQSASQSSFEELLVCHRCSARAHPSCLGYSTELAVKSRMAPWTCMDCKHCAICNMDHNIGTLIFCDECDRAYHLTCHQPPLEEQPHGSWICFSCAPTPPGQSVYDSLPGLPTPRDSPVPDDESRGSLGSWEHSVFDPRIPNAASWTVENVIDYFREKGFAENAGVFREQDIDGTALLMLTRSDVLTGLELKLGPALKIYKQVRILQTRLPNPPLP